MWLASSISAMNPKSSGSQLAQRIQFSRNSASGTGNGRLSTRTGEDGLLSEDAKAGSTSVSAWFPNCARNGATAGGTKGGAYRRDPDPWPSRGTPRGSRDPNSDAPHHPLDGQFLAQQKK